MTGIHRDHVGSMHREWPQLMEPASTVTRGTWNKRQLEDTAKLQRRAWQSQKTPGFLHILQRVMTARSPQRWLAQTSTNKGPSALSGKREGDHWLTWMTYCMTSLLHGGDHQTLHMPKLQRPRNNNCYICQFYRCLHTQLGRSLKWNLSFFKKKKMLAK